jgi:WD40 repeat protein
MRPDVVDIELLSDPELAGRQQPSLVDAELPLELGRAAWAQFSKETHSPFLKADQRQMRAVSSPNGQYWAAFTDRPEQTRASEPQPAGVCLIEGNTVVATADVGPVELAVPSNTGRIVAFSSDATDVYILGADGGAIIHEEFESNVSAVAISPDGQYAAVATAFPDNAVHQYDITSNTYLGRAENSTTSVIGYLKFESTTDGWAVATYEIAPQSSLDVDPDRKSAIDRIPAQPQVNDLEMSGIGIAMEEDCWHHVSEQERAQVEGSLRIPGVEVKTSCGMTITPLTAEFVYDDIEAARKSTIEFCNKCQEEVISTPDEKIERTHP